MRKERAAATRLFGVTPTERVLIVSPVRNEAGHIERVVNAMAAQTRPPDLWLVADDSSDDGTAAILRSMAPRVPFMRVVDVPRENGDGRDRLALALEAKAFNRALAQVDRTGFTHIGKLDGDIELPPDYFESVLAQLRSKPGLGLAGGSIVEPTGPDGDWVRITAPAYHVHGALKLYTSDCFDAVGGIQERLGWDTIDETYARMRGYETARDLELVARHHRPGGSADGKLRGRMRHGHCAYIARYSLPWVALRSLKIAVRWDPRGISGLAFLWGYLAAALRRADRVDDEEFKRFVRGEHRGRLRRALRIERKEVERCTTSA
jgi:glycosyltransferase involved in cell wall biosynthesis